MIRKEVETQDIIESQSKRLKQSHNLNKEELEVENNKITYQQEQIVEQEIMKEEQKILNTNTGEQTDKENKQVVSASDTQKQISDTENNQIPAATQNQTEGKDEQKPSNNQLQEIHDNQKDDDDDIDLQGDSEAYSDSDSDSGKEAKEISKEELNARRMAVFDTLSNLQMDRYECFRRASFQKSKMARVMKFVLRQSVNERMIISMQGIAKLFVGELIECARKVCMDREETGPLKPSHIHTAYQILFREGKIPTLQQSKKPF
eukprot:TRINITY_DN50507_c0_g1_i1.p1 TRINITY_DN50507_c0_g1~~TRINITY_DN50507_c0_g1_i1.p1  ORF type:complete len:262 (+),score=53.72 TRINITY_DN50507_c0_g1_i1:87-872(+)